MGKLRMWAGAFAAVTGIVASSVSAAEYSRMNVDVSALPKERQFISGVMLSRVWERTPPSGGKDGRTLTVRLSIDTSLPGEDAVVCVSDGIAAVCGGRFRAVVMGAGVLLRSIRYGEHYFALDDGTRRFSPKGSIRIAYLARHFDNWYLKASADEMCRYIEDLALWGMNGISTQLDYPAADLVWATAGDRAVFTATSVALAERVRALDMDLISKSSGANQAPLDTPESLRGEPNSDPKRGNLGFNVCPAKPGGTEFLCEYRRRQMKEISVCGADGFVYWPFDEGGCECAKCRPWGGNGFLKLVERLQTINAETCPNAKTIISTWIFHDDDWEGLYKWLETHDVAFIIADSHEDFPRYPIEHPTPRGVPVVTFPEISMWGRFPWGGTGANPLPSRFRRLYLQSASVASGFDLYSEGIYEDINKIFVNMLHIDSSRSDADILAEYARWEMPGCDPADFVALCRMLEDVYETKHGPAPGRRGHRFTVYVAGGGDTPALAEELERRTTVAQKAAALADKIDASILPRMRRAWRWRQIYLRAKIDASSYTTRDGRNKEALTAYAELTELYHAQRQVERLYADEWRGYTCPPFADCDNMPSVK